MPSPPTAAGPPAPGPELFPLLLEIGGHPALDLLNTRIVAPEGGRLELLRSDRDLGTWLGLAHPELPTPHAASAPGSSPGSLLVDVLSLRGHLEAACEALVRGDGVPTTTITHLNGLLAACPATLELRGAGRSLSKVLLRPTGTHPGILAQLAADGAELLSHPDLDRLRRCGSERCILYFLDQSRGGSRRWCSMRTCGNRAKSAAHRARHRNPAVGRGDRPASGLS